MTNAEGSTWRGPRPLHNPLDVARLGEIYSRTAAFYDGIVAEKQAAAKRTAIELLARVVGERFLDIGAGTGWAFSRIVAASGEAGAHGLDVSLGMLELARDAVRRAGAGAATLLLGDGRALPIRGGSIDCILTTYTFEVMNLPDIAAMLAEMLRVLRPGGRAAIVNLTDATDGSEEAEAMIRDWKRRYAADPESFGGARPLQMSETVRAAGFETVTRKYVGPEWPSEVLLARK